MGGEEEEETLVVSHGREVEVIEVHAVMRTVPTGMKLPRKKLEQGVTTIPDIHSQVRRSGLLLLVMQCMPPDGLGDRVSYR